MAVGHAARSGGPRPSRAAPCQVGGRPRRRWRPTKAASASARSAIVGRSTASRSSPPPVRPDRSARWTAAWPTRVTPASTKVWGSAARTAPDPDAGAVVDGAAGPTSATTMPPTPSTSPATRARSGGESATSHPGSVVCGHAEARGAGVRGDRRSWARGRHRRGRRPLRRAVAGAAGDHHPPVRARRPRPLGGRAPGARGDRRGPARRGRTASVRRSAVHARDVPAPVERRTGEPL